MKGLPTHGLLAALDAAAFQQLSDGSFEPIDVLPGWYLDFDPGALSPDAEPLTDCLPFLDSFVVDARQFWAKREPGQLRSGPFSQKDLRGVLRHMDAAAIFHHGSGVLWVQLLGEEFETMRSALQKVREATLARERLARVDEALDFAGSADVNLSGSFPDTLFRLSRKGAALDFTPRGVGEDPQGAPGEALPKTLAARIFKQAEAVLEGRGPCRFEYRDDSEAGSASVEVHVARCGADEVVVLTRDISARKEAEREIEETLREVRGHHDELLLILNELRVAAVFVGPDGKCSLSNGVAETWLGIPRSDFLGRTVDQLALFDSDQATRLKGMIERPRFRRERLSLSRTSETGTERCLELEVHDDPRDPRQKILLIYDVSEVHALRRQVDENDTFEGIVGRSKPMQQVFALIEELAGVDATVLIQGATGTGKELVARALHRRSARAKAPFIALNSAGLSESLVASQLFGHRRGSFTGAVQDQKGVFEAAEGGTVFLDEIGDIPPNVQTSLLRVLQEREIVRIGDTRPRTVDVRILAATHRNLEQEVREGRFRSDLLYRVRVARIGLPSLAERLTDLPLLAERFLTDFAARTGKPIRGISSRAMRKLADHDWPGNVRELQSAVEFAAIRSRGTTIDIDDLPAELMGADEGIETTDQLERYKEALKRTRGNRSQAARLLGISRATFYRRLAELDLSP